MEKTPDISTIAETIKSAMEKRGLRQRDLLEEFGYSRSRASEVVRGKRRPSKSIALKLSRRLDIPLKKLIAE